MVEHQSQEILIENDEDDVDKGLAVVTDAEAEAEEGFVGIYDIVYAIQL